MNIDEEEKEGEYKKDKHIKHEGGEVEDKSQKQKAKEVIGDEEDDAKSDSTVKKYKWPYLIFIALNYKHIGFYSNI